LKPAQVDALVTGYQSGKTMKELAAEFGINRVTVSGHLRRAAVVPRRGGLDQEQAGEAARLYEDGWSYRKLAERFNVAAPPDCWATAVVGSALQRAQIARSLPTARHLPPAQNESGAYSALSIRCLVAPTARLVGGRYVTRFCTRERGR
jgi:hypothetical protein